MNNFSAWDIAGAITYLPIAIMFWIWIFTTGNNVKTEAGSVFTGFVFALFSTFGLVFCVARLFGAHK